MRSTSYGRWLEIDPETILKSGYLEALAGSLLGAFGASQLFALAAVLVADPLDVASSGLAGAALLAIGYFGSRIIGIAVGVAAALRIFKRRGPLLTGALSIPVMIVGIIAMLRLIGDLGMPSDYGWLLAVFPFIVPLVARRLALAILRHANRNHPRQKKSSA